MPTPSSPLWDNSTESFLAAAKSFQEMAAQHMPAVPQLNFHSEQVAQLQSTYAQDALALWQQGLLDNPKLKDRRFAAEPWQHNPVSAFSAAMYLLNTRTLMGMTEALDTDDKTKARIRFAVEQWAAASAPSNFLAFNAEAQQKAIDTQGESIAQGVQNMLHDLKQAMCP